MSYRVRPIRKYLPALGVLVLVAASASAALPKSSDSFSGYNGLNLRTAIAKNKGFEKKWTIVINDDTKTAVHYLLKGDAPPFLGVKIDKVLLVVSKQMGVVVAFSLFASSSRCEMLKKAIDKLWGDAMEIGGMNHEIEWLGKRVDASFERDRPYACMLYINDLAWNDENDRFKELGNK